VGTGESEVMKSAIYALSQVADARFGLAPKAPCYC
jgi:hypothetical protein